MPCVLVLKRLPEGSAHDKAALNDILRAHGRSVPVSSPSAVHG